MDFVEFDVETESFHATFDSTRDSTSLAVVALVSTALGREPLDLTPIQREIDADEIDELEPGAPAGAGTPDSISFRYEGFDITVTSEEAIEASPVGANAVENA